MESLMHSKKEVILDIGLFAEMKLLHAEVFNIHTKICKNHSEFLNFYLFYLTQDGEDNNSRFLEFHNETLQIDQSLKAEMEDYQAQILELMKQLLPK